MAASDKPWGNVTQADYATAAGYCSACLIDLNEPGADKTKAACKLPVKEPGGDLNRNGVHAAAARLAGAGGGVDAPPAAKRGAAKRLLSYYGQLDETPPDTIRRMAGS